MSEKLCADICVIGGGSGGLSVAAGAAQMGAKVVLIEKGKMGGDCLNTGCVPSKALIAAAETAHMVADGAGFGLRTGEVETDFSAVHDHVHGVIAEIAPHDSVERFESLGVHVIQETAEFAGPDLVRAGDCRISARRFVIATGSAPFVPPIRGLSDVPFHTNESIFDLTEAPEHLVVVGGGPIGLEMAQAFRRLGSDVSVVEAFNILPKDDPDAAGVVRKQLLRDGVIVHERATVDRVVANGNGLKVHVLQDGDPVVLEGSHLLVAAGRRPNVSGIGLEAAGIKFAPTGISVDARLRTSNRRVFAIGDVAGGYQFTHMANYHAGIVIRNALFNLPAKTDERAVPWVTYTSPELAHVGVSMAAAKEKGIQATALSSFFEENDRAQAEKSTDGFIKVTVGRRGVVVGATIVGRHAGELILPWVLAVNKRLKMSDMAGLIAPYPTLSEISKRVAGAYFTPTLFSERTRRFVRLMQKLP